MNLVHKLLAQRGARRLRTARSLSADALQRLKDELIGYGPSAVPAVIECLGDAEARVPAMDVLGRLLTDGNLESYIDALSHPDPAIATGVARVIASGRGFDASRLLTALGDARIPKSVIESILHEQAAALPLDQLVFALPDMARDGQLMLFRLLEKRADPTSIPALSPLLAHPDPQIRLSATRLLSRFVDESVVAGLRGLVSDRVGTVRLEAVQALHKQRAGSAVPELVQALRDPDFKVQAAAIDAVSDLADATVVPQLLKVLADPSDSARRAAVEVLNVVATPEAIADLLRVLGDEDWWVRVRAADALGALGGEKVVQAVVGLMRSEDEFLRRQAVEILNAVPAEAAVEALIVGLDDSDWWVRERAIDALGKAHDPRAVEPLVRLMTRHDKATPLCARALGSIGDARAVAPLADLLRSGPPEFRSEAIEALRAFPQRELSREDRALIEEALAAVASPRPAASETHSPRAPSAESSGSPREPSPRPAPSHRPPPATSVMVGAARPGRESASPVTILNFAELPTGTVLLGRYRIVRKVGKGGFGVVYLVDDAAIQDQLVLKILNPQISIDENAAQRFVQEIKLSRRITHGNVIRIHDFLDLGGAHAVSMEYFPGRDLGAVLADGPVDVARGLGIVAQVCDGLAAAHAVGVVHRDIKPGNILVGEGDRVKILDFGLAANQQMAGSRLTKSGILIGSPEYMAPEQITGAIVDQRADLYSLGIVMYEMFSGIKPFVADTPVKVLFQHLEGEVEPIGHLVKGLSPGLEDLVSRAMARDPGERPASAAALRALIDEERGRLPRAA